MSLEAMVWALKDAPVDDPQSVLVLIALADRASHDGSDAYPARSWIAERARCSVRTVQRRLNELESAGVISRGDQSILKSKNIPADRMPVVWDLNLSLVRGVTPGSTGCQAGSNGVSRQVQRGDTVGTQTVLNRPEPTLTSRDDVERLCTHLRERILANGVRSSSAEVTKLWRDEARKLLDLDGVPEFEAHKVIDWCQSDSFWKTNILSFSKFRKQYDQLKLKSGVRGTEELDEAIASGALERIRVLTGVSVPAFDAGDVSPAEAVAARRRFVVGWAKDNYGRLVEALR